MVDLVGSAASQIASMLSTKKADFASSEQQGEKISLNSSTSSTEVVDEVSISNTAMEIGRVMEIVQEARARVESAPSFTLSDDAQRLDMLA